MLKVVKLVLVASKFMPHRTEAIQEIARKGASRPSNSNKVSNLTQE